MKIKTGSKQINFELAGSGDGGRCFGTLLEAGVTPHTTNTDYKSGALRSQIWEVLSSRAKFTVGLFCIQRNKFFWWSWHIRSFYSCVLGLIITYEDCVSQWFKVLSLKTKVSGGLLSEKPNGLIFVIILKHPVLLSNWLGLATQLVALMITNDNDICHLLLISTFKLNFFHSLRILNTFWRQ